MHVPQYLCVMMCMQRVEENLGESVVFPLYSLEIGLRSLVRLLWKVLLAAVPSCLLSYLYLTYISFSEMVSCSLGWF